MIIELVHCRNCRAIGDQFIFLEGCPECYAKFYTRAAATKWNIARWVANYPAHFLKLLLQDLREKS